MKEKTVYAAFALLIIATILLPQAVEDLPFRTALAVVTADIALLGLGARMVNRFAGKEEE